MIDPNYQVNKFFKLDHYPKIQSGIMQYSFNTTLGNVRSPIPSHGLLTASDRWQVTEVRADVKSAHVTSKLEFWKYPDWMAQWPFAHDYEITQRVAGGVLEVRVTVTNLGVEPMRISLGFHPFLPHTRCLAR